MLALACALAAAPALAGPWLAPGDETLRHDLQVLADAGVLRGPVTTWPVSWPDVARDVLDPRAEDLEASPVVGASLLRVQRAARQAARDGFAGLGYSVTAAEEPLELRTFASTPREEGELAFGGSWLGRRFAVAAVATVVADAEDGQEVRLDGSYVGFTVGNFMISAGATDRWWGPGWDGSLLLSSNARPIPSVTVERNYTDASKLPVLRWLGPWRASLALGRGEGSDVAVADTRFFAARVNFKPRPWLELGLSRTAQWCGEGRPCGTDTFIDLLLGRDNRSAALPIEREPGNQMAGYDFRLRSPWRALPVVVYSQLIGEDEAGGLPSKFLGILGVETWGEATAGSWRVRAEFGDTACSFMRDSPEFNCAYRNELYPQGYTFRGRIVGHALDADGRSISLGALLVRQSGSSLSVLVRRVELNRDGRPDPVHTRSPAGAGRLNNVEFQYRRAWRDGQFAVGVGYDDHSALGSGRSGARGFLRYARGM
jgi:hypothetical protein